MQINWEENKVYNEELSIDPNKAIEKLYEFITDERKAKIQKVLDQRSSYFAPVLEGLYDRGNISAVMRSAEAFGFHRFHIVETSKEFKESHRVTQGADKWLEVTKWDNTKDCILSLKEQGYKVYATHMSEKAMKFDDLDLSQKTAVIFGNERDGVSQDALDMADGNVLLPMAGFTQSFNISVAAALGFQRAFLKNPPKIDERERKLLEAAYYLRTIDWPKEAFLKHFK